MKSILQSRQWAEFKKSQGFEIFEVEGIFVHKRNLPFGKNFLYVPEVSAQEVTPQKIEEFKKLTKEQKSIFLRIEFIDHFDHNASKVIQSFGFKKAFEQVQPKWRQIIDISSSEDAILAQMKQKGRYNLHLSERKGVVVSHNLPKIMGFAESVVPQVLHGKTKTYRLRDHNLKVGDKVCFLNSQTGEIFGSALINEAKKMQVKDLPIHDKAHGAVYDNVDELISAFKRHNFGKVVTQSTDAFVYSYDFNSVEKDPDCKEFENFYKLYSETVARERIKGRNFEYFKKMLDSFKDTDYLEIFLATYQDKPVAGAIISFYDGVASYLYGGSSRETKEVMAPYLMHWQIIREAKKHGCKDYDMIGRTPPDQEGKWSGVTRFKEQFGGQAVEVLGSYDFVNQPIGYNFFKLIEKIRRKES